MRRDSKILTAEETEAARRSAEMILEADLGSPAGLAHYCTTIIDLAATVEALEEIRQRVADGWQALHPATTGGEPFWSEWTNGPIQPMSPEVASILWPEATP